MNKSELQGMNLVGRPQDEGQQAQPSLVVEDLYVEFPMPGGGAVHAVNGVSYSVMPGETLAIVGESGSGKSASVLSILGLTRAGRITSGRALIGGRDLSTLDSASRRRSLGTDVAMIFQNPSAALNPVMQIGEQIVEALLAKDRSVSRSDAHRRAVSLLAAVGVPEPETRARNYPHQFSGGRCQRVVIAVAMANQPRVLIADEPTTAVDVTIQAQLLDLIALAKAETGASTVLITHDLGVVAQVADRVAVMYGGRIVETGDVFDMYEKPQHPYTAALLASLPRIDSEKHELEVISGQPPDMMALPAGCPFEPRCSVGRGRDLCKSQNPPLASEVGGRWVACHFPVGAAGAEFTGERRTQC